MENKEKQLWVIVGIVSVLLFLGMFACAEHPGDRKRRLDSESISAYLIGVEGWSFGEVESWKDELKAKRSQEFKNRQAHEITLYYPNRNITAWDLEPEMRVKYYNFMHSIENKK